jgi:hypothetical protein
MKRWHSEPEHGLARINVELHIETLVEQLVLVDRQIAEPLPQSEGVRVA